MLLKNPGLRSSIIKKAITVSPNSLILDAIEILQKFRISRLVVVDKNYHPVGIITEKDILKSLFPLGSKPLGSLQVSDIMSTNLVTARKNDSVYKCAKLMQDNKISSIIVLDDKTMEGILTKTDLVFNFLIQETAPLKISKIMTDKVVTAAPDDHLFLVESLLLNNKISRIPIVKNQKLVGIITYRDFIPARIPNRLGSYTDPAEVYDIRHDPHPTQFNVNQLSYTLDFRAEDIMTRDPVTITPQDDVSLAALLMYRYDISGIPVTKQSKLAGIVTKSDIVFALAEEA